MTDPLPLPGDVTYVPNPPAKTISFDMDFDNDYADELRERYKRKLAEKIGLCMLEKGFIQFSELGCPEAFALNIDLAPGYTKLYATAKVVK